MRRPLLCLVLAWLLPAAALAAGSSSSVPAAADVARYAQQLLERSYPADGPGAAVLVARGDQVLFRGARGRGSVQLGVALDAEQVFRLGSITKQMAAAGVLTLAE